MYFSFVVFYRSDRYFSENYFFTISFRFLSGSYIFLQVFLIEYLFPLIIWVFFLFIRINLLNGILYVNIFVQENLKHFFEKRCEETRFYGNILLLSLYLFFRISNKFNDFIILTGCSNPSIF